MVFSSLSFLCVFLPAAAAVHWIIPQRFTRIRNLFLILMSMLFYSYGEPVYVLLMLFCTIWTYVLTRLMQAAETYRDGSFAKYRKAIMVTGVVSGFLLLAVFKYAAFLTANLLWLIPPLKDVIRIPEISLPIGISFYTFQSVSYIIDVYRKEVEASPRYSKVLLYVSFFPQLIAGPILRYSDMDQAMDSRTLTTEKLSLGIRRFIRGLSKKVLIANVLASAVDTVYSLDMSVLSSPLILLTALAYAFQIYFDFSGYSDMAIGMGHIFGFRFPENFNYPYTAVSMRDFWRRWHISLSGWFRDYLYIPLGGNRKGRVRTVINRMIVFFCTGLWHGASWTFVLWGLFHGFFVSLESRFTGAAAQKDKTGKNADIHADVKDGPAGDPVRFPQRFLQRLLQHVYVMVIVCIGFIIFRADTIRQAFAMIGGLLTKPCSSILQKQALLTFVSRKDLLVMAAAAILSMQLYLLVPACRKYGSRTTEKAPWLLNAACLILLVLSMLSLAGGHYNPFIYFRF